MLGLAYCSTRRGNKELWNGQFLEKFGKLIDYVDETNNFHNNILFLERNTAQDDFHHLQLFAIGLRSCSTDDVQPGPRRDLSNR